MKKVLIITYYWPPSGGGGVQRWLKFANYFLDQGWQPVVYTPENPEFPIIDESLSEEIDDRIEVIKSPIWEPYAIYKKVTSRKKDAKIATGFTSEKKEISKVEKLSRWIRGNWFIPDARKFWIKPSIKCLSEYMKENSVDAVISTGPPHSMHLIALGLKEKFKLKWIADFRDPWTNIDYIDDLSLSEASMRKHAALELQVLQSADQVVTVGNQMKLEFSEKISADKIHVIPNGFDSKDFRMVTAELDKKFTISHIGSFSPSRNLPELWNVLGELIAENEEFKRNFELQIVGQIDQSVKAAIEQEGLGAQLTEIAYLPHDKVVSLMSASQVLLLSVNRTKNAKGILTGKIFEYLKTNRPILAVGPTDGDLAKLLDLVNADGIIDYSDKPGLKKRIIEDFEQYQEQRLNRDYKNVNFYDRKVLVKIYIGLLDNLLGLTGNNS